MRNVQIKLSGVVVCRPFKGKHETSAATEMSATTNWRKSERKKEPVTAADHSARDGSAKRMRYA